MHPLAAELRVEADDPVAFLMLHGWTGSPAHLRLAAERVADAGYAVLVPRLAGHGTSLEHMVRTGWRDWVGSALEGLMELASRHDQVHVVGLSMGGVIALLLAATNDVASVTTINAPQRLRSRRAWMSRLYRGSHRIHRGDAREIPEDATAPYWVQYEHSPVGTVPDLLDLIAAARRALPRVTARAAIIQSRADETVHPDSARIIYAGLGSADKRIVWLDRSRHVAMLDEERAVIHDVILSQAGH